jgi:transforming growth factor-beta-induced protein|tara:strand:- start:35 stop:508 length:474 start_codon:yes stop_codon:yes gene_type:complete
MKLLKSSLAGLFFLGVVTTNAADIVDTAIKAGKFNTLVAAVKAAGLVKTLKGDGPFTVFAPTDDAFAKLPKGTLESLLKPENKEKLKSILTYHVVAAKVPSKDVSTMKVNMVNGQKANLKVKNNKVTINGANVIAVDIMASNGVIHVIDSVILPPKK